MSNKFMREECYIVFKLTDIGNSLDGDEIRQLAREYAEHLEQLVKKPLDYVVVGAGWSEYGPALRAIEVHVTGAQPVPSVPDGVMAALENLDDYIARIEGNDRGACSPINLIRRYLLDAAGVGGSK